MPHAAAVAVALAFTLAAVAPARAQAPREEIPRLAPVVVTPSRIEERASDTPASVTVIGGEAVRNAPQQTVDDLLRQLPSFSLFRRSSSLVTHPTAQGLSLRGIGPSGSSRALVLQDGVPINDPFGGWVYWNRIPLQSIEQIEVVHGGGSSVWGNGALGGVVHVLTRRPVERAAFFEASYGSYDTRNFDLLLTEAKGPLRLSLEGNYFDTGGYPIVKESRRGAIDIDATSRHSTFNGRVELVDSPDLSLFASGNYFDEDRGNGTPLQFNRTGAGAFATRGRLRAGDFGQRAAAGSGHFHELRSRFPPPAADRNSETLALDQTVPSTSAGGYLQWNRRFGSHLVASGGDIRWVDGETQENVYVSCAFARTRIAGS